MNNQPHSKKVYQYDLNGKFVAEYSSHREAAFHVKAIKSGIKYACEGIHLHCNNFYFTYEYKIKLDIASIPYLKKNSRKIISKFDLNGKYLEHYISIKEAAKKNNILSSNISSCLSDKIKNKTAGGFIWIRNLFRDLTKDELLNYIYEDRKVYQYDLQGNFITEYNSIIDLVSKTKFTKSGVWSALNNYENIKTHKNYIFLYEKKDKIEPYKKEIHPRSKKVYQYDLNGKFIREYISANQASKESNINCGGICACCLKRPRYYSAGGFIWRYNEDVKDKRNLPKKELTIPTNEVKIYQYDLDGNFLKEYKSITEACKKYNIKHNTLSMCLNGGSKSTNGFMWKYKKYKKIKEYSRKIN
jgi:hypothetical protein